MQVEEYNKKNNNCSNLINKKINQRTKKIKKNPIYQNNFYINNNYNYFISNKVSFRVNLSCNNKLSGLDFFNNNKTKNLFIGKKIKRNEEQKLKYNNNSNNNSLFKYSIFNTNTYTTIINNKDNNNNKKINSKLKIKSISNILRENEKNDLRNKLKITVSSFYDTRSVNDIINMKQITYINTNNNLIYKIEPKKNLNFNTCEPKIKKAVEFLSKYAMNKRAENIINNNCDIINRNNVLRVNIKKINKKKKVKIKEQKFEKAQKITVPFIFNNRKLFAKISLKIDDLINIS